MALTFNDDGKLAIPVAYCLQVLKKSNKANLCIFETEIFGCFEQILMKSHKQFPVIREKNFTLISYFLEEFGSSKISHLFWKGLFSAKPPFPKCCIDTDDPSSTDFVRYELG